ncbi:MAG: hypothetical protein IJ587_02465 [Synergistaceae bacterium]|nr:hypothetical protein [Synergistaceae bacterium]
MASSKSLLILSFSCLSSFILLTSYVFFSYTVLCTVYAINRISSQRAKIGSYINGLEHTMNNLTTTSANLNSAESRIRDADMAKTMMEFVKLQILNQSGTSMLSQANQLPQSVLSLLGN